jgi:predicted kinase
MQPAFVLFSGLPGTGKSTLADRLAHELRWPLLRIDDIASLLGSAADHGTVAFWDRAIAALLYLTEAQLKLGVNVIADSVFMDRDRYHARAIARQTGARFLPVHTFVSDELVWEQRVTARHAASAPADGVASWERIQVQRRGFRPWEPGTALPVDTIRPPEENFAAVLAYVTDPGTKIRSLPETAFTPGKYHEYE